MDTEIVVARKGWDMDSSYNSAIGKFGSSCVLATSYSKGLDKWGLGVCSPPPLLQTCLHPSIGNMWF